MAVELAGDRLAGVMVQVNSAAPNLLDAHLRAVHQATGADVVVQDYPLVSGVRIPATALADVVARSPHVTAVKAEAPPTPVAVAELTRRCSVPVFAFISMMCSIPSSIRSPGFWKERHGMKTTCFAPSFNSTAILKSRSSRIT